MKFDEGEKSEINKMIIICIFVKVGVGVVSLKGCLGNDGNKAQE